jgi:hypothetical protein
MVCQEIASDNDSSGRISSIKPALDLGRQMTLCKGLTRPSEGLQNTRKRAVVVSQCVVIWVRELECLLVESS